MRIVRGIIALGIAIAAVAAIYVLTFVPLTANAKKTRLDAITAETLKLRGRMYSIYLARRNLAEIEPLLRIARDDVDLMLAAAANYRIVERYNDAVRMYERSLLYAQRPEIYLNLGLTLLEAGRREEAIPHFIKAARYHPSYVDEIYDPGAREDVRDAVARPLQ